MRLWRRASGALKDQNSIWLAGLTRRTALRNPDIEAAVIRATSHDETNVDYRSAQRVFAWVRMSPAYLKPLVWALSMRMQKTRSWVVALKGLMLMHGVFCCRVPSVQKIGRLPFDLSNFSDGHSNSGKTWANNAFIRCYYAFLDQKSTFLFLNSQEQREQAKEIDQTPLRQELLRLHKLQNLLDMLLQIKPQSDRIAEILILEAMDCVVIEIFDIYSRICNGIAKVLMRIYSTGKNEAAMALDVLLKASAHGEQLTDYFEFCRGIGVINAAECPKVDQIPEEDIKELEDIINGVSRKPNSDELAPEEEKAIAVWENQPIDEEKALKKSCLQTVVTSEWEVFDEDSIKINGESSSSANVEFSMREDHYANSMNQDIKIQGRNEDLPDLISFL